MALSVTVSNTTIEFWGGGGSKMSFCPSFSYHFPFSELCYVSSPTVDGTNTVLFNLKHTFKSFERLKILVTGTISFQANDLGADSDWRRLSSVTLSRLCSRCFVCMAFWRKRSEKQKSS